MATSEHSVGQVTQVIGPVVDVAFSTADVPEIGTALKLTNPGIDDRVENLTLEVSQHLGEHTVRAVAMDTTDGLGRGQEIRIAQDRAGGVADIVEIGQARAGIVVDIGRGRPGERDGTVARRSVEIRNRIRISRVGRA